METVELIARGYEWVCPNCEKLNMEVGITEEVKCWECGEEFKVHDYHHAYE